MEFELLIFDLDDTLISTEELYVNAKRKMASYLESLGFDYDEALSILQDVDRDMISRHGVDLNRFPMSMAITYRTLCHDKGVKYQKEHESNIRGIGFSVYKMESKVLEGAERILEKLKASDRFRLCILTRGDIEVQTKRALESGLLRYFDNVFTTGEKTPRLYDSICSYYGANPLATLMIGNSLYSDILPALEAGLYGLYLHNGTYELEDPKEIAPELYDRMFKSPDLESLIQILEV